MNKKRLCVVIPIYKEELNDNETSSLESYNRYFQNVDFSFIAPERLDCSFYIKAYPQYSIERFNDKYFKNAKTYNKLMLDRNVYARYSNYEYIVIAQTDAIIFNYETNFDKFMNMGYDYIGPPWYSHPIKKDDSIWKYILKKLIIPDLSVLKAGNGGFSLRKIDKFIKLLDSDNLFLKLFWHFNEDIYFASRGTIGKNKISVAPQEVSEIFALDEDMKKKIETAKPVALHAWELYFSDLSELNEIRNRIIQVK